MALLFIFTGIVGVWMDEGFLGVQQLLSPFNIGNWIVSIITLAPGMGLLMLSRKLQDKLSDSYQ